MFDFVCTVFFVAYLVVNFGIWAKENLKSASQNNAFAVDVMVFFNGLMEVLSLSSFARGNLMVFKAQGALKCNS